MSKFYVKDNKDQYIPIELGSMINQDMNNSVVVVKVGTETCPATLRELELTADSFREANILQELDVSIILTPFQIDVGVVEKKDDLDDKCIYMQISKGDNIDEIEDAVKQAYKAIKKVHDVVVLPTPMKVKDYKKMKDILARCNIRKNRRSRAKG